MKICICGGGALGHVCAGVLSASPEVEVSLLTARPERWRGQDVLTVTDLAGKKYVGRFACVSSNPAEAAKDADLVFLCLPGYLIADKLKEVAPFLRPATLVGSIVASTGFFFQAHNLLPPSTPLFAFQRTPFIARVDKYGESARLLGYKKSVSIAVENAGAEAVRSLVERLFVTPTTLLNNYYEASLTNSNPILHTGRLYSLWADWDGEPTAQCGFFYKEWTDAASQTIIGMDEELGRLLDRLPVDKTHIPSLLDYYECSDAASLTRKIASIEAFRPILSPMRETPSGWVPDFGSRYFTEDFPYGLRIIRDLAAEKGVKVPLIERVLRWGLEMLQQS